MGIFFIIAANTRARSYSVA